MNEIEFVPLITIPTVFGWSLETDIVLEELLDVVAIIQVRVVIPVEIVIVVPILFVVAIFVAESFMLEEWVRIVHIGLFWLRIEVWVSLEAACLIFARRWPFAIFSILTAAVNIWFLLVERF